MSEVKKGDKYLCIADVIMQTKDAYTAYKEGKTYISEKDGCVTNELGNKEHYWFVDAEMQKHFKKLNRVTYFLFGDKSAIAGYDDEGAEGVVRLEEEEYVRYETFEFIEGETSPCDLLDAFTLDVYLKEFVNYRVITEADYNILNGVNNDE